MKVVIESINTTAGIRYIVLNASERFVCGNAKEFKTISGATKWATSRGYTL